MFKDTPKSLLDAVKGIVQHDAQKYAAEQAAAQSKYQEKKLKAMPQGKADEPVVDGAKKMAEGKEHTVPKTDKEKKLAALAEPKDKITHADVMAGRGVRKEGWEEMMKAVKDRAKPQPNGGAGKKEGSRYGGSKQKDVKEATDTPGNSTHQCAIHVKSEQFGEGKTLFSQHAEPDAQGQIAWYDVMFAEGIKRVDTKDIEILVSESHMNHKKKKMNEGAYSEQDIENKENKSNPGMRSARKSGDDDHLHVSSAGGGKYKVHSVGKNLSHGIKKGEHLSDSELDDAAEMGAKIKHVKGS